MTLLIGAGAPAQATRRVGAARTLRLEWPGGASSSASQLQPVVARDKKSGRLQLIFTQLSNGTRNVWQAAPGEADQVPSKSGDAETEWKNLHWQATPLTRLKAPSWADDGSPTADGRGLVCSTNALLPAQSTPSSAAQPQVGSDEIQTTKNHSQIVYLDIASARAWPLTNGARDTQPALSPAGRQLAFVSDRSGLESIFVMPIENLPPRRNRTPSIERSARRVATMARHPLWIDEDTLLFQSTRPGTRGIYRLSLTSEENAPTRPQLVLSGETRGGLSDVAFSPDRRSIAIVADTFDAQDEQSKIYLLAPDGSGVRAVPGTEGAANPFFAPDNSALFFDKPAPEDNSASRLLWMVPLASQPPVAQLQGLRGAPNNAIEVFGEASSAAAGVLQVSLEWGEGRQPSKWHSIRTSTTPLLQGALASWRPPRPEGEWMLRLTATDSDGDRARSTLAFATPLTSEIGTIPVEASSGSRPPIALLPSPATPPDAPLETAAPTLSGAQPATVPIGGFNTDAPTMQETPIVALAPSVSIPSKPNPLKPNPSRAASSGAMPFLPLPSLPPAPGETSIQTKNVETRSTPRPSSPPLPVRVASSIEIAPFSIFGLPAPAEPNANATVNTNAAAPSVAARDEIETVSSNGSAAKLTVPSIPATWRAGANVPVQIALQNVGDSGWFNGGATPTRVFYRWTDKATDYRARWAYRWLPANIAPRASAEVSLSLAAPSRAGNFRLDIGLIEMPGGRYSPPSATARVNKWPGEFGVVSFDVAVR